jgi:hypothetical protein
MKELGRIPTELVKRRIKNKRGWFTAQWQAGFGRQAGNSDGDIQVVAEGTPRGAESRDGFASVNHTSMKMLVTSRIHSLR